MSQRSLKSKDMNMLVTSALVLLLVGCQSPRHESFKDVKPGMEKDVVLESAGGPYTSRRWNGKDRWIYEYRNTPNGPVTKEVHFKDGKVVYSGDKVVPAVSAAEQDRLNDESNRKEAERLAAEERKWETKRGAARPTTNLDRQDLEVQNAINGTVDMDREKTKLAPTFDSVE